MKLQLEINGVIQAGKSMFDTMNQAKKWYEKNGFEMSHYSNNHFDAQAPNGTIYTIRNV